MKTEFGLQEGPAMKLRRKPKEEQARLLRQAAECAARQMERDPDIIIEDVMDMYDE